MGKTVYILGAGFSKSVGAPLQSQIIDEILKLNEGDLFGQYEVVSDEVINKFRNSKKRFGDFLEQSFYLIPEQFKDIALEDVFSSIDRSLSNNLSFRGITREDLQNVRKSINALIIFLMRAKLRDKSHVPHIRKFANYLVNLRKTGIEEDPFSIISTNWDILIENALVDIIPVDEGMLDYCFYTHLFENNEKNRSGLFARGKGLYNVKVLKLHGSMNWLQCQRCERVYITFFNKIALQEFFNTGNKCHYCSQYNPHDKKAFLKSVLIMPTFLKDLNNFNLKLVWQISGIELQEASKIIFMGYSFPLADFELRHLLASSVRSVAKIDVILCEEDKPDNNPREMFKNLPEYRYRSFFGKRRISFCYDGVEKYIEDNFTIEN